MDKAVSHRLTLGSESWKVLLGFVKEANHKAKILKADFIDAKTNNVQEQQEIENLKQKYIRKLSELEGRANSMAEDGRVQEMQHQASDIGYNLLRLNHFAGKSMNDELHNVARNLHLIETERIYIDGGKSIFRVLSMLQEQTSKLKI